MTFNANKYPSMTEHDTVFRLQDMRDAAQEAVTLIQGRSRTDLHADRVLNLALVRLLKIVGEAIRAES